MPIMTLLIFFLMWHFTNYVSKFFCSIHICQSIHRTHRWLSGRSTVQMFRIPFILSSTHASSSASTLLSSTFSSELPNTVRSQTECHPRLPAVLQTAQRIAHSLCTGVKVTRHSMCLASDIRLRKRDSGNRTARHCIFARLSRYWATRHQTPDTRHQASDIRQQTSENRYRTTDIRQKTSYIVYQTSLSDADTGQQISDSRHQTSNIRHQI